MVERPVPAIDTQTFLLDAVDASVIATDRDGCVTHWNRGAERLYGWSAAEAVGERITSLMIGAISVAAWLELRRAAEAEGSWEGELDVRDRLGQEFQIYSRTSRLPDVDDRLAGFVTVSVDISERIESERRARAAESYLRAVTDSMGEGLITLDSDDRVAYMNHAAERMLGWRKSQIDAEEVDFVVRSGESAGQGLAGQSSPAASSSAEDSFMRRDGTLLPVAYRISSFTSSEGHAGRAIVFRDMTSEKLEQARTRRQLAALECEDRIRDALAHDRFCLFAQPIVEIRSNRVIQHELLLRMLGAEDEIVAPDAFLPAAEDSGLITQIDRWVLEDGLHVAAAGHAVSLNLSAASLGTPGMFEFVEKHLRRSNADPKLISFELTESALLAHEERAEEFLSRVSELGCQFALDDFGTGYGGFTYLKRLHVHYLKIDREFVRDLPGNRASQHVVEAVVALARGFGQKTVAEGVESRSTLPLLAEIGVDFAQGYALGRPRPLAAVFPGDRTRPRTTTSSEPDPRGLRDERHRPAA